MNDQLVVLTKEPRLGEAKTRLAGDVGPERARELAEAFVLDTLALARSSGVPTLVAFAPEDAGPWFEARAPWASLWPQPDGDLGQRMRAAIREALGRGAERCVMIGMDTPHLPATTLESAFAALDGADLVLGPSLDGGYYLIGAKADHPSLFEDLAWSTAAVLGATLGRARELGLEVRGLPPEFDVDRARDLEHLADELRRRPEAAPATRALLLG